MKCRWHAVVRLLGLAVGGICYAAASGNMTGIQASAAEAGFAALSQRVTLEYQEITNSIYPSDVRIRSYTKPFKRDPDRTNYQFFRGFLEIGRSTNDHLPLVWDFERGRLWLDLNRNRNFPRNADGGVFIPHSALRIPPLARGRANNIGAVDCPLFHSSHRFNPLFAAPA